MFHNDAVPYRIETRRTTIRCWDLKDAGLLQQAIDRSLDTLLPWMPWAKDEPKEYRTKIATLRFFRGSFDLGKDFVYAIFDRAETTALGGCGLHTRAGQHSLEIGYWIRSDHQNQGYATEITRALVKTAFEYSEIDNIQIMCDVKNAASLRVIEKVGFRKEGVLLHRQKNANGEFQDLQVSVLLRDDYLNSDMPAESISVFDAADEVLSVAASSRM